jgi:hypothetical protein
LDEFPNGEIEAIAVMEIVCDKIFNSELAAKVAKFFVKMAHG